MRTLINPAKAPKAIGPYSHAVKVGNFLFLAGQLGIDPATGNLVPGGVREEMKRILENIAIVVTEAGFSLGDVVKTTCYLTDFNNYKIFNEEYAKYFSEILPARETVQVPYLAKDASVEISLICCKG